MNRLHRVAAAEGPLGVRAGDAALTVLVIAAVELTVSAGGGVDAHPLNLLAYVLGAVLALPVLVRRRHPLGALLACALLLLAYYTFARRNITPAPLLCLPLYDAAGAGSLAWAIVIPAFYMTAGLLILRADTHSGLIALLADFLPSIAMLLLAVLLGDAVRSRRALARAVAERLRLAAEEREAETARQVAEERLRIARDLHDTVAHGMTTIAVLAGSALHNLDRRRALSSPAPAHPAPAHPAAGRPEHRGSAQTAHRGSAQTESSQPGRAQPDGPDGPPDDLRAALTAIRATSKSALTEMRAVLGQLRAADSSPGNSAPPAAHQAGGVEHLPGLAAAVTAAGSPVRIVVSGAPAALPLPVDHAVYRIVQESLTNVLRHAGPQATAIVQLDYGRDAVTVTVTDNGNGPSQPGSPAGGSPADGSPADGSAGGSTGSRRPHGIAGMRERAVAAGGELAIRRGTRGGFEVAVTLPLRPPPGRLP